MTEIEAIKKLHRYLHYDPEIMRYHNSIIMKSVDDFLDEIIYGDVQW